MTQGDEFAYARALEGAAQGLTLHETLAALDDQNVDIREAVYATADVARALEAEGIKDDDLDESWIRYRSYLHEVQPHG
jgi:hypothetical protein